MKNIFIDAGAYKGLYVKRFKEGVFYRPDFLIYAFECSPALSFVTFGSDVNVIRKALWVYDGKINFYISKIRPEMVQGSSVYKSKTTGNLDTKNPITVDCIDFSKFLKNNIREDDNLIVKMNIEGAEYKVLEKCCKDGTISLIKKLFIQWHYHKIGLDKKRHTKLLDMLSDKVELYNGFGLLNQKI